MWSKVIKVFWSDPFHFLISKKQHMSVSNNFFKNRLFNCFVSQLKQDVRYFHETFFSSITNYYLATDVWLFPDLHHFSSHPSAFLSYLFVSHPVDSRMQDSNYNFRTIVSSKRVFCSSAVSLTNFSSGSFPRFSRNSPLVEYLSRFLPSSFRRVSEEEAD